MAKKTAATQKAQVKTNDQVKTVGSKKFKKVSEFWTPDTPGEVRYGYLKLRREGIKVLAEPDEQGRKEVPYNIATFEQSDENGEHTGKTFLMSGSVINRKLDAVGDPKGHLLMIEFTGCTDPKPNQNPARLYEVYVSED